MLRGTPPVALACSTTKANIVHRIETDFAGRKLVLETGRMAKQASGIGALEVGQQPPPRTNHLQQSPATVMVLRVIAKMAGE